MAHPHMRLCPLCDGGGHIAEEQTSMNPIEDVQGVLKQRAMVYALIGAFVPNGDQVFPQFVWNRTGSIELLVDAMVDAELVL